MTKTNQRRAVQRSAAHSSKQIVNMYHQLTRKLTFSTRQNKDNVMGGEVQEQGNQIVFYTKQAAPSQPPKLQPLFISCCNMLALQRRQCFVSRTRICRGMLFVDAGYNSWKLHHPTAQYVWVQWKQSFSVCLFVTIRSLTVLLTTLLPAPRRAAGPQLRRSYAIRIASDAGTNHCSDSVVRYLTWL